MLNSLRPERRHEVTPLTQPMGSLKSVVAHHDESIVEDVPMELAA